MTSLSNTDIKIMCPVEKLSGRFEGSFAYVTIKDRLPVITTKIIDHLCREKVSIAATYGKDSQEEIKVVIGHLSLLKNRIQTNKSITEDSLYSRPTTFEVEDDTNIYLKAIKEFREEEGSNPKWFTASWMFLECYLYKKVSNILENTQHLKSFDPFCHLKKQSLEISLANIKELFKITFNVLSAGNGDLNKKKLLSTAVQISTWGNQCDLSFSSGKYVENTFTELLSLGSKQNKILVNEFKHLWRFLENNSCKNIAVVLDNAGVELIADLHLLSLMTELGLCDRVDIYPKTRPWFVSDVTIKDIHWTLDYLRDAGDECLYFSQQWSEHFRSGKWNIKENVFWTTPILYRSMKNEDPKLYEELSKNDLLIFKGDLNYRKLVGDLDWPNNTPLEVALQGFKPSNLLILRTIKGGPAVGIDESCPTVIEAKKNEQWFYSGQNAMIQFYTVS